MCQDSGELAWKCDRKWFKQTASWISVIAKKTHSTILPTILTTKIYLVGEKFSFITLTDKFVSYVKKQYRLQVGFIFFCFKVNAKIQTIRKPNF
jgi:hypothetical protein